MGIIRRPAFTAVLAGQRHHRLGGTNEQVAQASQSPPRLPGKPLIHNSSFCRRRPEGGTQTFTQIVHRQRSETGQRGAVVNGWSVKV